MDPHNEAITASVKQTNAILLRVLIELIELNRKAYNVSDLLATRLIPSDLPVNRPRRKDS